MRLIDPETGALEKKPGWQQSWSTLGLWVVIAALWGVPWFVGLYEIIDWVVK